MRSKMPWQWVAAMTGFFGLSMVLGAVFFQFVIGVAPCEMCYWQRYPHALAACSGLLCFIWKTWGRPPDTYIRTLTFFAIGSIFAAGLLGIYHSGVEWKLLPGPSSCTGDRYVFHGPIDLNAPTVVRCDVVSWRLFHIFSLANLNAIFSLSVAGVMATELRQRFLSKIVEWFAPGLIEKLVKIKG